MKIKSFFKSFILIAIFLNISNLIYSQNYYWIGNSGNWSDLSHWSTRTAGDTNAQNHTFLPGEDAVIIFDTNSFTLTNQTVNFDVIGAQVKSIVWETNLKGDNFNPTFTSNNSDSLLIKGSLTLEPAMVYDFKGAIYFTDAKKDSLVTSGHTFLNDISINNVNDTLTFKDDFTSLGGIYYNSGGLILDNLTIDATFFISKKSSDRKLNINQTIFNLNGSNDVLTFNSKNFEKIGSAEVINLLYSGNDTVNIDVDNETTLWNEINIDAQYLYFKSSVYFNTITALNLQYLRTSYNKYLNANTFNINGDCGRIVDFECIEGISYIKSNSVVNLDYFSLKNIHGDATGLGYNATNSVDVSGNDNITITENSSSVNFYWIGGKSNFYDPTAWSYNSGDVSNNCVPGPNDNAIFDVNSLNVDTLFLDDDIVIGTLDFSGLPANCVIIGENNIEIRRDLLGSTNLQFDWTGTFNFTNSITNHAITSNNLVWSNIININSINNYSFTDDFSTTNDFILEQGNLSANSKNLNFYSFYSNTTSDNKTIDFSNSKIEISGIDFHIDTTNSLTSYNLSSSELIFKNPDGEKMSFITGNYFYNEVRIQTNNVNINVHKNNPDVNYALLDINPGSTVILANGTKHICDSIIASGDCKNMINLKSNSSTDSAATIQKIGYDTITLDYIIVDRVNATDIGEYNVSNSKLINNSYHWDTLSFLGQGEKYIWINGSGNWSDISHWTVNGSAATCLPSINDTVVFDDNSFTTKSEVVVDYEVYVNSMLWINTADTDTSNLMMKNDILVDGDVKLNDKVFLTRNNKSSKLVFQPVTDSTSILDPNNSLIDVTIVVLSSQGKGIVDLTSTLSMSDSSVIIIGGGIFNTNNNNIATGTLYFGSATSKIINLGSSNINLTYGFIDQNAKDENDDPSLKFNAATSTLVVDYDSLAYNNSFITTNLTFYNVVLNLNPENYSTIMGDNTFNNLTIGKGSKLNVIAGDIFTVLGDLNMIGNCNDSIFIQSSIPGNQISFDNSNIANVECINFTDVNALNSNVNAIYSSDINNNSGLIFDFSSPVSIDLNSFDNLCLGDTVTFVNSSTSPNGNPTYDFDFGDGYMFSGDTSSHYYENFGQYTMSVIVKNPLNFCSEQLDTLIKILNPSVTLASSLVSDTTICAGEEVTFIASARPDSLMDFNFLINSSITKNTLQKRSRDTLVLNNITDEDTISVQISQEGCIAYSDSIVFKVNALPVPVLSSRNGLEICDNDSVILDAQGGDVYQYFKNNIALTAFDIDSLVHHTVADNDSFNIIAKNTATNCVDTSGYLHMIVNDLPIVVLSDNDPLENRICIGDNVDFIATSVSGISYTYFKNDNIINANTSATYSYNGLNDNDVVTVTTKDAKGCVSLASNAIQYEVNNLPIPKLTSNNSTICSGEEVIFYGDDVTEFTFIKNGVDILQGPSGTNFFKISNLVDGDIITLDGKLSGCSGTSLPIVMTVDDLPNVNLTSDITNIYCSSETPTFSTVLEANVNYEFYVNNNVVQLASTNNSYIPISNLNNGDLVSIKATNISSTCENSDAINLTVNPSPSTSIYTNINDNKICEDGVITVSASGGNNYEFFVNSNSQTLGASNNVILDNFELINGINKVYVKVVNSALCETLSDTIEINMVGLPQVNLTSSATSNVICEGEPVLFTADLGADEYQFLLNNNSLGLPSATNQLSFNALQNNDEIKVIAYNDGCANNALNSIITTVNNKPTASISGTSIFCEGTSNIFTGGTGTNYKFGVNDVYSDPFSTNNTFDASTLSDGNFVLNLIVEDNNCTDTVSKNISILSSPVVSLTGNNLVCADDNVLLSASGANEYQFYVNNIPQGAYQTSTNFNKQLQNNDVVSVVGRTPASCVSSNNASVTITVNPNPNLSLTSSDADDIICEGETVDFTITGADKYEFFINGFSVGNASTINTYSSNNIINGQVVKVIGELNGCFSEVESNQLMVVNYPIVSLTNLGIGQLCTDENTNLIASGADEYQFIVNGVLQGNYSTQPTFNQLLNNGDVVSVQGKTNTCSKVADNQFTYEVFSYPNVTFTSSSVGNEICDGEMVNFEAFGAERYEYILDGIIYNSDDGILDLDIIENNQLLEVKGYNGHCGASAAQTVSYIVNTLDIQAITSPSNYMLCNGENLTLNLSGADQYEVFVNGESQGSLSNQTTYSLNNLNQNDFIDINGFSNSTSCLQKDDETIYVSVADQIDITVVDETIVCEGDTTYLISSASYGNQWLMDGNIISGATDSIYAVLQTGDFSLEVVNGGNGTVWSFGYNSNGEFGSANNYNSNSPIQANELLNIQQISTGNNHVLGLNTNGEVYSWGINTSGQLGQSNFTPLNTAKLITALPSIEKITAGKDFSFAVTTTGGLFAWGGNNFGQLGLGSTVVYNVPQLVVGMNNVSDVKAGRNHALVLKSDGTVWACGNNEFGQLGINTLTNESTFQQVYGLSNIVSINVGDYHSIAIDNNGNAYVWGNNSLGQLGLNNFDHQQIPTLLPLLNVKEASGGYAHSLFVTNDAKLYVSGSNNYGQLGTGDVLDRIKLTQITSINSVSKVSAGSYHSLIQKKDGSIWAVGRNDNGQLGLTEETTITSISKVGELIGVTQMEAGIENSHFIYGTTKSCQSEVISMEVKPAPKPEIIFGNDEMTIVTSETNIEWDVDGIELINSNTTSIIPYISGNYTATIFYGNGCERSSDPFNHILVGIKDITSSMITVYPNPVKTIAYVTYDEMIKFSKLYLTDALGKIIFEKSIDNRGVTKSSIDFTNFTQGVYFLHLEDENGSKLIKNIIKN